MERPPLYSTCFITPTGNLVYRLHGYSYGKQTYIVFIPQVHNEYKGFICDVMGRPAKPMPDTPIFLEDPDEFYVQHNAAGARNVREFRRWLLETMVHEIII